MEISPAANGQSIPYVSSHFSIADIKQGYAAWKEHTSTSPEGDHLGMYKVLLKDLGTMTIGDRLASDVQNDAWFIITCILNLGATYGLSLPRWEKTVCVMIEKSPGNHLLNKLRRIFIMANDYNLAVGSLVGRRLFGMQRILEPSMRTFGEQERIEEPTMPLYPKSLRMDLHD